MFRMKKKRECKLRAAELVVLSLLVALPAILPASSESSESAQRTPKNGDDQNSYPLVRVIESTRGCVDHQQYEAWLPCLRNGEKILEGDVLLLIQNGTFEEGAVVQRQVGGNAYGPRYWTPPNRLMSLESDLQDSLETSGSTKAWDELQVGETYRLKAEETPLMPGLTLNVEGDDLLADFERIRYLPAGETIHVLAIDRETRNQPWYQVRRRVSRRPRGLDKQHRIDTARRYAGV